MAQGWAVIIAVAAVVLMSGEAGAQTPKSDTLLNGVVNGALAGGASAFAFVKVAEARCGPGCEGPDEPLALYATIGGAGIGSVVGLIVDKIIRPKPSSPSIDFSPRISAKRKTLMMRLRW